MIEYPILQASSADQTSETSLREARRVDSTGLPTPQSESFHYLRRPCFSAVTDCNVRNARIAYFYGEIDDQTLAEWQKGCNYAVTGGTTVLGMGGAIRGMRDSYHLES